MSVCRISMQSIDELIAIECIVFAKYINPELGTNASGSKAFQKLKPPHLKIEIFVHLFLQSL